MKKFFIALIAIVLVFTACPTDDGNDNSNGGNSQTTLTISNLSFFRLVFSYGSVDFVIGWGEELTKDVNAGSRYGYITGLYITSHGSVYPLDDYTFKTDLITCEEGKNTVFGITSNTVVTLIGGYDGSGDITGTLKAVSDNLADFLESDT